MIGPHPATGPGRLAMWKATGPAGRGPTTGPGWAGAIPEMGPASGPGRLAVWKATGPAGRDQATRPAAGARGSVPMREADPTGPVPAMEQPRNAAMPVTGPDPAIGLRRPGRRPTGRDRAIRPARVARMRATGPARPTAPR